MGMKEQALLHPGFAPESEPALAEKRETAANNPTPSPNLRRKSDTEFDETRAMLDALVGLYEDERERDIARAFFRLGMKRAASLLGRR